MTTEEKAKAYDEALKWMRELYPGLHGATKEDAEHYFPELHESKNERVRNGLIGVVSDITGGWPFEKHKITKKEAITYLEKQKELAAIPDELVKNYKLFYEQGDRELALLINAINGFNKLKEQKPNFSEKNPTDFEIEVHEIITQARNDSRLNDADVLKQFEEEAAFALMLKANKLIEQQKSEEDEDMLNSCISSIEEAKENRYAYKETDGDTSYDHEIAWLKSLRPQPHWKPSNEQINYLGAAVIEAQRRHNESVNGFPRYHALKELYEQLLKL